MEEKTLQDLINLHVDYPNPRFKNGHIVIGAALIEKRITTFDEYADKCKSLGISRYGVLAKQVLIYDERELAEPPSN